MISISDYRQQWFGNIRGDVLAGMAGCAMIGQSIINVKSGGRGRLSAFSAGVVLLVLVVGLGDLVARIPMPALVAIMIMVSIGTFSWSSIKALRVHPRSSSPAKSIKKSWSGCWKNWMASLRRRNVHER